MQPLVSVIIPVYNNAAYLNQCLASVVDQTYQNLQIILVDDASGDESALILRAFAEVDTRIHVETHATNQGVSAARNTALQLVRGDYVIFVDADDWVEPNYVRHLVTKMVTEGYDLVVNPFITEREVTRVPADRYCVARELTQTQFLDGVRSQVGQIRGYLWKKFIVPT